jgi:hypothetical protein|tara:strand:+ start:4955 stop:5182 length:228 start_codon:yes stop_codon:yes gene_type:complete
MAKYYVQSGTLSVVILAKEPFDAIRRAIKLIATTDKGGDHIIDHCFYVGERGFESPPEHLFPTEEVFKRLSIDLS